MNISTSVLLGSIALAAAFACVLAKTHSDVRPEESTSAKSKPSRVRSIQNEADGQRHRKSPERHARSEFLKRLDKLAPNTDFDDPGDGYFQGYLLVRRAEEMRALSDESDVDTAVTEHFERAYAFFLGVQRSAPDWKVQMVTMRIEKTKDSLREAYDLRDLYLGRQITTNFHEVVSDDEIDELVAPTKEQAEGAAVQPPPAPTRK